jgi:hypothetical protein
MPAKVFNQNPILNGPNGAHDRVLVEALCYKPEGDGFESPKGHLLSSSIYPILPAALCPGIYSDSNRFIILYFSILLHCARNKQTIRKGKQTNTHARNRKLTRKTEQENTNGNVQSVTTCK